MPSPDLDAHSAQSADHRRDEIHPAAPVVIVGVDSVGNLDEHVAETGFPGLQGDLLGVATLGVPDFPDVKTFALQSHVAASFCLANNSGAVHAPLVIAYFAGSGDAHSLA